MILEESELGRIDSMGASGGQGVLYDCPELTLADEPGRLIFKKYKPEVRRGREDVILNGMSRLIQVRNQSPDHRRMVDRLAAWPLAVVRNSSGPGASGIVMRHLTQDCYVELNLFTGPSVSLRGVVQYMQEDEKLQLRAIEPMSSPQRWEFLLRVADFLRFLHHNGVVFGDISGNNIIVRRVARKRGGDSFYPVFIDCDGCRLHGTQPFLKQANTPEWVPPEARIAEAYVRQLRRDPDCDQVELARWQAREKVLTKPTDVYKFVVLLNRLLHRGMQCDEDVPQGAAPTAVVSSRQAYETATALLNSRARVDIIWAGLREEPSDRPTMEQICRAMFGS